MLMKTVTFRITDEECIDLLEKTVSSEHVVQGGKSHANTYLTTRVLRSNPEIHQFNDRFFKPYKSD